MLAINYIEADMKGIGIGGELEKERMRVAPTILSGFPLEKDALLSFVRNRLGEPLVEYDALIDGAQRGAGSGINVVKLQANPSPAKRVHHRGGELAPHTGRSWSEERPAYFAMLMVNPGWRNQPPGHNGESLFVSWRSTLEHMRAADERRFGETFHILSSTAVTFAPDNVREKLDSGPIIYRLDDSEEELDVGVRMKQDLPAVLRRNEKPRYLVHAVEWLQSTARALAMDNIIALEAGELVIIDNNRWAHGRCNFVRQLDDKLNPREVWSLTTRHGS